MNDDRQMKDREDHDDYCRVLSMTRKTTTMTTTTTGRVDWPLFENAETLANDQSLNILEGRESK